MIQVYGFDIIRGNYQTQVLYSSESHSTAWQHLCPFEGKWALRTLTENGEELYKYSIHGPTVLRRVMRDIRPPGDLRQPKARIAACPDVPVRAAPVLDAMISR